MNSPNTNRVSAQTKWYAAMGVACVVIVALFLFSSIFKGSSSTSKYEASVVRMSAVNPNTVSVEIKITNNGAKSGSPLCTIEFQSPSSGSLGNNEFVMNDVLQPGKSVTATQEVTVNNQASAKATSASITCS